MQLLDRTARSVSGQDNYLSIDAAFPLRCCGACKNSHPLSLPNFFILRLSDEGSRGRLSGRYSSIEAECSIVHVPPVAPALLKLGPCREWSILNQSRLEAEETEPTLVAEYTPVVPTSDILTPATPPLAQRQLPPSLPQSQLCSSTRTTMKGQHRF